MHRLPGRLGIKRLSRHLHQFEENLSQARRIVLGLPEWPHRSDRPHPLLTHHPPDQGRSGINALGY